jgi:hypothetical protein
MGICDGNFSGGGTSADHIEHRSPSVMYLGFNMQKTPQKSNEYIESVVISLCNSVGELPPGKIRCRMGETSHGSEPGV